MNEHKDTMEILCRYVTDLEDNIVHDFEVIASLFANINKQIKSQTKLNRRLKVITIGAIAGLYFMYKRELEQDKKIKDLEKSIEEMNVMKGV